MRKWNVFNLSLFYLSCQFLTSCAQRDLLTVRTVQVIQPNVGQTCSYQVAPATLQTLDSLTEMRGRVGRVVTTKQLIKAEDEIMKTGVGFLPLDLSFHLDGNTAFPTDLSSLFGASLYYSIESSYLLFRQLDTKADLGLVVPNFAETTIIYNAKAEDDSNGSQNKEKKEVYDNAEYLPIESTDKRSATKNYFLSYPTKNVKDIPLGLNLGVMTHEFTHMVFHHLFLEPGIQRNTQVSDRNGTRPTENTLAALDEGIADYFGFMITKDPAFIQCSFPFENRDLAVAKEFTEDVVLRLEGKNSNFDPHEGGAVFAAIQYQIGQELGSHETNATTLVRMMYRFLDCQDIRIDSNTVGFDFGDVAKCHLREYVDGTQQAKVRSIYEKYLGFRYKGR